MKNLDLTKIMESMKDNDISELIVKEGKNLFEIRRGGFKPNIVTGTSQPVIQSMPNTAHITQPPIQQQTINTAPSQTTTQVEDKKEDKKVNDNLYELKSPLVGTFYASPKPDSPPFIEVGDKVKKGQTICIVEAMKNFNEIESEVNGTVREICIGNLELVEFGKVLFKIELD